jgi:hypothetical protein
MKTPRNFAIALIAVLLMIMLCLELNAQSRLLIPYRKGESWGYCDVNKKIVIPVQYKDASLFEGNYATVENDSGEFLINKKGEKITGYYKTAYYYADKNYMVCCKTYGDCKLMDGFGKVIADYHANYSPFNDDGFSVVEKGFYERFLIDRAGKTVTKETYNSIELQKEKMAIVMTKDYKYGLLNLADNSNVPCVYDRIYPFKEGLALAMKDKLYGFIDKKGNEVVPFEYDRVPWSSYFGEQNFFNFNYDNFSEGLAVLMKNGKCGYINKQNQVVIPFIYDRAFGFDHGLAWVQQNEKWGMVNKKGKLVIPCEYDEYSSLSDKELEALIGVSDGMIRLRKNELTGFADSTGRIVVPLKYENTSSFHFGVAGVQKNEVWGFIDKTGKEIIPPTYKWIYNRDSYGSENPFEDGNTAIVMPTDTTFILINKQGVKLAGDYVELGNVYNGYSVGFTGTDTHILDRKGKIIQVFPGRDYLHVYPDDLVTSYSGNYYFNLKTKVKYVE